MCTAGQSSQQTRCARSRRAAASMQRDRGRILCRVGGGSPINQLANGIFPSLMAASLGNGVRRKVPPRLRTPLEPGGVSYALDDELRPVGCRNTLQRPTPLETDACGVIDRVLPSTSTGYHFDTPPGRDPDSSARIRTSAVIVHPPLNGDGVVLRAGRNSIRIAARTSNGIPCPSAIRPPQNRRAAHLTRRFPGRSPVASGGRACPATP